MIKELTYFNIFGSFFLAFVVSFLMTPVAKWIAPKIGAMDIPKDERRVHNHPIPRMGGLAIFMGFALSMLLFADMTLQVTGILLGAVTIVAVGAVDDIVSLKPWVKLAGQVLAAAVAIRFGVVFDADDIYAFRSFADGREILEKKHGIKF